METLHEHGTGQSGSTMWLFFGKTRREAGDVTLIHAAHQYGISLMSGCRFSSCSCSWHAGPVAN